MKRYILGYSAVAVVIVSTSGCIASSDPTPDEQDVESSSFTEEAVGVAQLELTSTGYSTYLGGTTYESMAGIAVDSSGNVYVAGTIASSYTDVDIFVSKMSPTGARIYFVSFGGNGVQNCSGLAIDSAGNAYVTGTTSVGGSQDTFVAKLNATGSALLYYVSFGGSGVEYGGGIAVDGAGNAYVTGATDSTNFPVTAGAFQRARGGDDDAFVAKLNPSGNALLYSTYLGGARRDHGSGIAVDAYGYAYVTGSTELTNGALPLFPTTSGAFRTNHGGGVLDAFVTQLTPSGSSLYYSTYLGGVGEETGRGIAVDSAYNAYVTGGTSSYNFPTLWGAFSTSVSGRDDAFVTKLNASGSGALYSTYLGGNNEDFGTHIAVNSAGKAYVTGFTYSTTFPTTPGAFRTSARGMADVFVSELNAAGSALSYSSYVGGSQDDESRGGIAVDRWGNAYIGGATYSSDFPTVSAAQPVYGGGVDSFVVKINGP